MTGTGPNSRFVQQFGRDKMDKALAPSDSLHDEQLVCSGHHASNSFIAADSFPEKCQCSTAGETRTHGMHVLAPARCRPISGLDSVLVRYQTLILGAKGRENATVKTIEVSTQ